MTTPQPTPSPGPPGTRSSPDWLANLILTARTITAAAECLPFPYLNGALGPIVPILEAVQKMTKNRDDFEELCENIVGTVKVLQEKISLHDVTATTSLQRLCGDLECLLNEIQLNLGQIQKSQKNRVLNRLKEFSKSISIGDELTRYKTRLVKLRNDFILMSVADLNINAHEASVPGTQAPLPPITTSCPPPSRMFHGRREILDKLHAYFSQDIGKRHVSLLHGLGGAGKTQICLKFLDETEKSRFMDVFFLDASTIDTIKRGLRNISVTRGIGSEDEDASRWLASRQDEWLLIFDNADDPRINLFHYFPQSSTGNILITSRNPKLHVHAPDAHYHISDMEEEDAVKLLLASAVEPQTTDTEVLATEIVKALHCFALAVVQAGAFIAQTGKLRNFLTLYEQNHAQLLSRLAAQSHDKYAWSVYTTWDLSFKSLGSVAARFLQICSFLHHEEISEAIFSKAATYQHHPLGPTEEQIKEPREFLQNFLTQIGTWDELRFTDITTEIQAYSLMNQDYNTNSLFIHPLVHDWTRNTILDADSTRLCTAVILAMSVVHDDQVFHINLLPHLNSVLHDNPQLAHNFPYPYEQVYYSSGHFQKSQELCEVWLKDRKDILGNEHPHTLIAMSCLAATYGSLGKFTDAEELQVSVLEKRKEILGPEHLDTLYAMANLAATYWKLSKFKDAEELQVSVLEKRKRILGPEHLHTLDAMANLAVTYSKLGKFADAEELQVSVLQNREQILGTEHPKTLDAMAYLAATYWELGRFTNAQELEVSVLEKRKRILGPEHPDTLNSMANLAATYSKLGKFADAEELQVSVLQNREQILGTEHPKTLDAMAYLAVTYSELGRFTNAEELEVSVLEKRKRILSPEHSDTLNAMENLALTYQDLGKFAQAEQLWLTIVEKKTLALGPEHQDTVASQEALAQLRKYIENHNSRTSRWRRRNVKLPRFLRFVDEA